MSTDTATRTSLATWIARLVRALDGDPHGAGDRLRAVVEGSRGRIGLDGETVLVTMRHGVLIISDDDPEVAVGGSGETTSATVVALLDGALEVLEAVETGLVHIVGTVETATRMFTAIELLLDGSSRVPALRRLGDEFVTERGAARLEVPRSNGATDELALLARLGLLAETPGGDRE